MTFKKFALSAVAASGIIVATSALPFVTLPLGGSAQAQTDISVNFGFGTFYDRLQPYGSWVSYQDQYVFVPENVNSDWRPYTRGHWVLTDRYGWLWVSNEPFGWATYHYGRWGYARDIGWFWVPGHRWAPAWVAWSRGDSDVAWAPLPPRYDDDVSITINVDDVPDYYWQAVPTSAFLSINLSNNFIHDRDRVRTFVHERPPQTIRVENNIVINDVIQVNEIERATNKKVPVFKERLVNRPDAAGKMDQNSVAIFNPDVKPGDNAKPKRPVQPDQFISQRKAKGFTPKDLTSGQPPTQNGTAPQTPQTQPPADQPAANKGQQPGAPMLKKNVPIQGQGNITPDAKSGLDAQGKLNNNKLDNNNFNNGKQDLKPRKKPEPPLSPQDAQQPKNKTKLPQDNFQQPKNNAPADQSRPKFQPRVNDGMANPPLRQVNPNFPGQGKPLNNKMPGQDVQKNLQPPLPGPTNANPGKSQPGDNGKKACDPAVQPCPPPQ